MVDSGHRINVRGRSLDMANYFHVENGVLKSYTGREDTAAVPENVHTIGEGAFKGCVSLKEVILPFGVRRIEAGAFKGCRRLRRIQMPESVSYIGSYAFHRCHGLERISVPESVKELGDCVFLYCDSLTEVRIPGVERLGKQVFVNDVLLKKLEISPCLQEDGICDVFTGCIRITDFSFPDGREVLIPSAVEAVAGNKDIPSLVRTIAVDILRMMELEGRCLAKFLTNLKHVEIPEGIEKIGKSSFFDKRGIISVKFPASLKEIESRAFRNCISLESVVFQEDQVLIREDAFKNCSSLKEVGAADGTSHRIEGIGGFLGEHIPLPVRTVRKQVLGNFRLSGRILLKYLGSESRVVVPQGVTVIAEEAFAGNEAVDRVILPDSVEEIGAGAFRDCLLLQTIEFPANLKQIGSGAFENCVKLIRVFLPEGMNRVEDKVFKHCNVLKEVAFGRKVVSVGEQAFYGCLSLQEIHFPDSLASIGEMAFYRCRALREVYLLPGIKEVGNLAFAQSGVKKAVVGGEGRAYGTGIFFGALRLRSVVLEQGVRHIPDRFACNCTSLKQVALPDTLESAGRHAWENTPFLKKWREEGCGGFVFWDGRDLEGEVELPEQVRITAGGAFYGNGRITAVHFSDSVMWIGPAALKGCTSLQKVTWPSEIEAVGEEVFSGCVHLEYVACRRDAGERPVSWKRIGERAFYRCRKLCGISLKDAEAVGKEAFSGCASLVAGEMKLLKRAGENAFEESVLEKIVSGNNCLFLAGSIIVSGHNCTGEVWIPEGITAVAPFAFSGNRQITRVFLPEGFCEIGDGAFWGCSALSEIRFPSSPCKVGERAFEKCTGLPEICACVSDTGKAAFAYCTSLKKAELRGLQKPGYRLFEGCRNLEMCICGQAVVIGDYCFSGCRKLRHFDLSSVREIGRYAFQNCDAMEEISLGDHIVLKPHAFKDCGCLEKIELSGDEGCLKLCEYAFSGCTALSRVVLQGEGWELKTWRDLLSEHIPEAARVLFHSAFSCFEVEREEILCGYRGAGRIVRIPEGIRRIEAEVFRDVLMLEKITIPETVEYIGARAFHGTAWLEGQKKISPMVVANHMLLDGSGCMGEVTVGEDIRLVCGWAFANGLGIEKIRFLSERVKVEAFAFRNCIYLKELVLGDGFSVVFQGIADRERELPPLAKQAVAEIYNCFKTDEDNILVECTGNISRLLMAEGITAIGERAFQDGNLLTEIILPSSVTAVGRYSFAGCKWLKTVRRAYNVKSIGDRAFSGCGALERIELSEELVYIGARAFENCTSLKEIFLPEGMEEIPDRAFFRCHELLKIYIPSTVKRIGKEAFACCRKLQMPEIAEGVFVEDGAFAGIASDG